MLLWIWFWGTNWLSILSSLGTVIVFLSVYFCVLRPWFRFLPAWGMQVVITHIYRLGAPKLAWTKKCGLTDCCQGAWQMSPAIRINKGYCCSVAKSCLTLCDPMDCSTPGIPVLHYLPELAKNHIYWVRDVIQQSHLLSSPSLPAFNLAQHQGLFQWINSSHQVAKVLEFQLQHQSFQWIFRTDILYLFIYFNEDNWF